MSLFIPRTPDFVEKKAKRLHKLLKPVVTLSAAQEITARALGFDDYFNCRQRLKTAHEPSASDELVDMQEAKRRWHRQINAVALMAPMSFGDATDIVRSWRPTSSITPPPPTLSLYDELDQELASVESGRVSRRAWERDYKDNYDGGVEPPRRIASGIILAPLSFKHEYFVLSRERWLAMPDYFRGRGVYLKEENGAMVSLAFPELKLRVWSEQGAAREWLAEDEPWLHELHFGVAPAASGRRYQSIEDMIKVVERQPDRWFPLSLRFDAGVDLRCTQAPALRGKVMGQFLRSKCKPEFLQSARWFDVSRLDFIVTLVMGGSDLLSPGLHKPIPEDTPEALSPLYSSPFKHGPMQLDELDPTTESGDDTLNAVFEASEESNESPL